MAEGIHYRSSSNSCLRARFSGRPKRKWKRSLGGSYCYKTIIKIRLLLSVSWLDVSNLLKRCR